MAGAGIVTLALGLAFHLEARSEAIERIKQAFDAEGITIRSPRASSTSRSRGDRRSRRF